MRQRSTERSATRFSGRTVRRPTERKKAHEAVGAPPEFHENGAPELPVLPDEYNRKAPLYDEAAEAAKRHKQFKKLLLVLSATGALALGLAVTPALKQTPSGPDTEPTQLPVVVDVSTPEPTVEASPEATQKPTEAPTPEPTAVPTEEPTPEPTSTENYDDTIESVELQTVSWERGEGEGAEFWLVARIPKKNVEKGISFLTSNGSIVMEVYAWVDVQNADLDDWHGIMTASEYDTEVFTAENGDMIAIMRSSMYWPKKEHLPLNNSLVTFAVTAGQFDESGNYQGESAPSNRLTVAFGQNASVIY